MECRKAFSSQIGTISDPLPTHMQISQQLSQIRLVEPNKHDWWRQLELCQSVRIRHYSGSHMEANTCTVLKVNEFTEAEKICTKIRLMEWGSRSTHVYFLIQYINLSLTLTLTMFLTEL